MHEHRSRRLRHARIGKLALALGTCLCAGTLLAGPAAAAPATTTAAAPITTAVAQQAAAPVHPIVRIGATKTIRWGATTKLSTWITDPSTGKPVNGGNLQFQAWRNGAWRTWMTRWVRNGVATYYAKPFVNSSFRLVYTGIAGKYKATASATARVYVLPSGAKILSEARKHTGAPYRFGASGPRVFDCSGYTSYVYRVAAGKKLPHKANLQQRYGKAVAKSKAKPGDLIVIRSGTYGTHVGVYAGGGYMYDSPRAGKTVGKHKIWSRNYVVRRLI
ncbi:NlpC/P60 family protein [Actinomycetes bacterium KLBMP 9797]